MMTELILVVIGIFLVLLVISVLISAPYINDDNDDQIM